MAGRIKADKDNGEVEFTRAAYDTLVDIYASLGMMWKLETTPTSQRGVFETVVAFHHPEVRMEKEAVVSIKATWPNANSHTYGVHIFQLVHKAAQMASQWHACWVQEQANGGQP